MAWIGVAAASDSPPKLAAARAVFGVIAPVARVSGRPVLSGVAAQPRSDRETRRAARQRAERTLAADGDADPGIGMEAGIAWVDEEAWTVNGCIRHGLRHPWPRVAAAVAGGDGRIGFGRGLGLLLPPVLAREVAAGTELGKAIDALTGRRQVGRAEGTVGVLTGGLIDRADMWRGALAAALSPFPHPALHP